MTAAIVVNDRLLHAALKGSSAQWQPWSPDQLHNLTLLAQAAVGFDTSRGDILTIEDLAFDENRLQPQVSVPARLLAETENSPVVVKYVALILGLLVVLAFGVRPALNLARADSTGSVKRKNAVPEPRLEAIQQTAIGAPDPPVLDPERLRTQEIFEQVTGHLKREPTQSSRLLQSWIHSE